MIWDSEREPRITKAAQDILCGLCYGDSYGESVSPQLEVTVIRALLVSTKPARLL